MACDSECEDSRVPEGGDRGADAGTPCASVPETTVPRDVPLTVPAYDTGVVYDHGQYGA